MRRLMRSKKEEQMSDRRDYATAADQALANDAEIVRRITAANIEIVADKPLREMLPAAIRQWEKLSKDRFNPARAHPDTAQRLLVNYIRHAKSNYDKLLNAVDAAGGTADDKARLRARFYRKLAAMYPMLARECKVQNDRRHNPSPQEKGQ